MFLNETHIAKTFIRKDAAITGIDENILVVEMEDTPEHLKQCDPKSYDRLSQKLAYLNNLAENGFLDFSRIEVISTMKH